TARDEHTATLLPSGKVLVTGGQDKNAKVLSSSEVYDPANNAWSSAAAMGAARAYQAATLLATGRVLVTGGSDNISSSAELYDPVANTWSAAAAMATPRKFHTATVLANGSVLVTGGVLAAGPGKVLGTAELYDSLSGTWFAAGSMFQPRFGQTATLL